MNTWPHEHQHHGDEGLWNNLKLYSVMNTWPHEHQHHGDDELWNKATQFQEYMTPRTPAPWRWWTLKQNCTESWTYDVTNTSITAMMNCETKLYSVLNTWRHKHQHYGDDEMRSKHYTVRNTQHEHQHHGNDGLKQLETVQCHEYMTPRTPVKQNCTVSWIHDVTNTSITAMMNCETHITVSGTHDLLNKHYSIRNTRSVKQTLQCQEHTTQTSAPRQWWTVKHITLSGTHDL